MPEKGCLKNQELYAVVAMGRNGEIGFRGDMPWHLPEDLRHFKELTMGHPVIMGRATWLSLPKRPLPGRRNIVLTGDGSFADEGTERAGSIKEALSITADGEIPFIIGGGKVYASSLPMVSKLFVTRIEETFPDADTHFPPLEGFRLVDASETMTSKSGLTFRYETYENCNNQ